ncbi:MAG: translation elongation factor Ts [Patescibacteria group bacterium]
MEISAEAVKELREKTGVSVMDCKKALVEAEGDMQKALELLRERAALTVGKKADRTLGAGAVGVYVHNNVMAASVALSSETDFVAKNEEFIALARDIAMHVSAMQPENVEALLLQPYIKDESKTIQDLLSAATHKFGERIEVSGMSLLFATRK